MDEQLRALPSPEGRIGWPWSATAATLPATTPSGFAWPRISIITPSYNQGQFIEATLRSVLLQGYPNLEYLVIDGGSNDESVAVIRQYEPWLTYWVSERDRGQSHAINKGFALASGEVVGWLNSDDILLPGALASVGAFFAAHRQALLVSGQAIWRDDAGRYLGEHRLRVGVLRDLLRYHQGAFLAQPAVFFRRSLLARTGPLDERLYYTMDHDLWLRAGALIGPDEPLSVLPTPLAALTAHQTQKTATGGDRVRREVAQNSLRYAARYGLGRGALLVLAAQLLQFRAYNLFAERYPGEQPRNPLTLARATGLWVRNLPLFLLTPSYGKFALRCLLWR